jgi:hypothetical protein
LTPSVDFLPCGTGNELKSIEKWKLEIFQIFMFNPVGIERH